MPKRKKSKVNSELKKKYPCFKAGRNENETECIICETFKSVANKGSYDLEAHINSAKHTHTNTKSRFVIISQRLVNFFIKQNSKAEEWAVTTEGALSFDAVKHYIGGNYSSDCPLFFIHKIWSLHFQILNSNFIVKFHQLIRGYRIRLTGIEPVTNR
jgi:hypothetical protein